MSTTPARSQTPEELAMFKINDIPPEIVRAFEDRALAKQAEGFRVYSAQDILEEIRWSYSTHVGTLNWAAPLSRWFMEKHKCPEFFSTRDGHKGPAKLKYRDISIVPEDVR